MAYQRIPIIFRFDIPEAEAITFWHILTKDRRKAPQNLRKL